MIVAYLDSNDKEEGTTARKVGALKQDE